MEPEGKVNEDLVAFMRKRSETDAPRYTARLKTYLDIKQKRRRAAAARRQAVDHNYDKKPIESSEQRGATKDQVYQRRSEKGVHRPRSLSRSRSDEPEDACRRPRRRRRRPRKSCRRRSRRRRRRRRRRSCRRRRRRSSSRRRRRRSCRRRRRRRRRRRCCG